MPTRSGVHGARRPAPQSPTVRVAAASQAASSASETPMPTGAEVGQRLHDVAVGVAHVERVGAIARADRRVAPGADPERLVRLGDLQRLVPVAGAHAADRGQAVGRVRDVAVGVRIGEVRPAVGERAAQAARGQRERPDEGDRNEREHDERRARRPAGARRGEGARWALAKPMRQAGDEQDEEHGDEGDAELVAGRRRDRPAATLSVLSGFEAKAQKATRPPQKALVASTATPRRRSGTIANHSAQPHGQRQQRAARVGEQQGDERAARGPDRRAR